jgi:hypothetical protein
MTRHAPPVLHPNGKFSRRPPLPFKTRLRLRATRRVDVTAAWPCGHGMDAVAVGLWRVSGLW